MVSSQQLFHSVERVYQLFANLFEVSREVTLAIE